MATYKHLRSSTANKRPTTSIADGQLAINTNTASPGLFFKDSAGTGIVKVGPAHVGTTAPNSVPAEGGSTGNYTGEQWLDTSVSPAQMKVWNGSAWVGIVADELPVSKLQDGAAGQIVQTDSAGTGVEWSSTANLPLGSAAAPAYRFQGDANTGIYSPGADQLALSTNGTGRLFVDASGNVDISSQNPTLKIASTSSQSPGIVLERASGADYDIVNDLGVIRLRRATDSSTWADLYSFASDSHILRTNDTERLRITSAGLVGIGTSSPSGPLEVQTAGGERIIFDSAGSNQQPRIQLIRDSGTDYAIQNAIAAFEILQNSDYIYRYASDAHRFYTAGVDERMRITSDGKVGIGTTSPINPLEVSYSSATQTALRLLNTDTTATAICGLEFDVSNGASGGLLYIDSSVGGGNLYNIHLKRGQSSSAICFDSPTTEHARIDSSGRLLIGTSSDSGGALLQVNGNRIRVATAKTPASASDTGTTGEICWDASYIYVCTATNTWKRAALSTW